MRTYYLVAVTLIAGFASSFSESRAAAIVQVAAGGFHSAAVKDDGTVWAWGPTSYGILGDTKPEVTAFAWPHRYSTLPVQVTGKDAGALAGIVQISAGQHYTLALAADGTVWAWGSNDFGQLGDGSQKPKEDFYVSARERSAPRQVVGPGGKGLLRDVTAIAAGYQHAIALYKDGTVWGWGDNSAGQLGNGSTEESSVPVQVRGAGGSGFLKDIIAIAAGTRYGLALRKDGTVWAWGSNSAGQLGDGTLQERHAPIQVKDMNGVKAVSAGTAYSMALLGDGTIRAWGNNAFGQIGDGTREDSAVPVQVKGVGGQGALSGITAIAAGRYYAAALDGAGTVWVWGFHEGGLLGNGTLDGSLTPALVKAPDGGGHLTGIRRLAAGSRHLLALGQDGTLLAWGANNCGQLGDGGVSSRLAPVRIGSR